jgi:hypothetical protein
LDDPESSIPKAMNDALGRAEIVAPIVHYDALERFAVLRLDALERLS